MTRKLKHWNQTSQCSKPAAFSRDLWVSTLSVSMTSSSIVRFLADFQLTVAVGTFEIVVHAEQQIADLLILKTEFSDNASTPPGSRPDRFFSSAARSSGAGIAG